MQTRNRMLGFWCGVVFFILWGTGLALFARWVPPIDPMADAETIALLFQSRNTFILLGVAIMTATAGLYLPWTVLLSDLIKSIESPSYMLSQTQIVAGVMSQITFFIPPYMWGTAAYRAFRDPVVTQSFVDAGWLIFITGITPFILQYVTLAIAIFSDKREIPLFPRWAGYLQIWISLSFIPAILPFFIRTGPFAWNGFFVWWLPAGLYVAWFVAMLILTRKAIMRLENESSEVEPK